MQTGIVKSWFDAKGFGFITQQGTHGDIFVHHTQIRMEGRRALIPGQRVRFELVTRDRGLTAAQVEVVDDPEVRKCHACGQGLQS